MSGFLLDTNILSELTRPEPDRGVMDFMAKLEAGFLSVLTLHELEYGLQNLPVGDRRTRLERAVNGIMEHFRNSILPVESEEAKLAGKLRSHRRAAGQILHLADALIAATAITHSLTVVTRNSKDFRDMDVEVMNPWG